MSEKYTPLVSIIIPVYNGSNYLESAIESALNQTYKNIEIIVVNDGSTDNTEEIALSFKDKIKYFSKENGGVAAALNYAIKKSQGEYISWLSHDDLYMPDKIEAQIKLLSKLENKKTILYSDWQKINSDSEVIEIVKYEKSHNKKLLEDSIYVLLNGLISGCSLLIHKDIFKELGYFREDLLTTQDYDLWFKMFPNYPIKHINRVLVSYRIHQAQDSRAKRAYHLSEEDRLWADFYKKVSNKKLDEIFSDRRKYLISRARWFYHLFNFNAAIEAMLKVKDEGKQSILLINPPDKFNIQNCTDINLFILKIKKDEFRLFYCDREILFIKLKSPIGFEFNNMFLQNEATMLIEKILIAYEIDVIHILKFENLGFDIVRMANELSVPVFYSLTQINELWLNPKNEKLQNQIELFAGKHIFTNLSKTFIVKGDEHFLSELLNNNNMLNQKEISKNEFFRLETYLGDYKNSFKNRKKYPDKIRKIMLNDLLDKQEHTTIGLI